jgi:putative membrane protein
MLFLFLKSQVNSSMNNLLIKLIVNTLSVFITAWILGDAVQLDGFGTAILVAIVLALLNVTIKPLLIFFTIPATVFSLGLFLFVINAVVILLADNLIAGFAVRGFWWALLFSLVMSFVNSVLNGKGGVRREPPR